MWPGTRASEPRGKIARHLFGLRRDVLQKHFADRLARDRWFADSPLADLENPVALDAAG
jgi:hypothetical protein